jgi:hypothetical protein
VKPELHLSYQMTEHMADLSYGSFNLWTKTRKWTGHANINQHSSIQTSIMESIVSHKIERYKHMVML